MFLFDQLRALGDAVQNEFPMINRGGCCVYAAEVAKALSRRYVPVSGIVCMSYVADGVSIDNARSNITDVSSPSEWGKNGIWFSHIALEFIYDHDDYHHDTEHLQHRDQFLGELSVVPGRLTVQELIWLASTSEGWNPSFNRDRIPALRKMIKKYLK